MIRVSQDGERANGRSSSSEFAELTELLDETDLDTTQRKDESAKVDE